MTEEPKIEALLAPPLPSYMTFAASKTWPQENSGELSEPRMAVITIGSTGNKERDVRRLKRIHGALVSSPGHDHFVFQVFENNRNFLLEFPNETTGLTADLLATLVDLAGEGNLRIDPYRVQ